MHINAFLVHCCDSRIQIDEALVEGVDDVLRPQAIALGVAFQLRALLRAVLFEQAQPFHRIPVGVDVNGAHCGYDATQGGRE